jgi:hypothetical protein
VIARTKPITAAALDRAPELRLIAHGIGLDNIPLTAAGARLRFEQKNPSSVQCLNHFLQQRSSAHPGLKDRFNLQLMVSRLVLSRWRGGRYRVTSLQRVKET